MTYKIKQTNLAISSDFLLPTKLKSMKVSERVRQNFITNHWFISLHTFE